MPQGQRSDIRPRLGYHDQRRRDELVPDRAAPWATRRVMSQLGALSPGRVRVALHRAGTEHARRAPDVRWAFCALLGLLLAWGVTVGAAVTQAQGQTADIADIRYLLEGIEVRGHATTRKSVIIPFVPFEEGDLLSVGDWRLESLRYRLLGTGWFSSVQLSLKRGSAPGRVVLVVEVVERNTLVIQQLAAGVGWSVRSVGSQDGDDSDPSRRAQPYLGLSLAETNLFGFGGRLGLEFLLSGDDGGLTQRGFALRYADPNVIPGWSLRTGIEAVRGREYFGGDNDVFASVNCSAPELSDEERLDCQAEPDAAVLEYRRVGLRAGMGHSLGRNTRLFLQWRLDLLNVPPSGMPEAASELRGRGRAEDLRVPIDFAVERGHSVVSVGRIGLTYDRRDNPALPSSGVFAGFTGDLASNLVATQYEFVRLTGSTERWVPIADRHVLRFGAFLGALFGRPPFFYKFFVADLTDLQPARILGLNLDHRPAPNLFGLLSSGRAFDASSGTAVSQMRKEELAARVDMEYAWSFEPRGGGFLRGGELFVLAGLYGLADPRDLRIAVPGYQGAARVPVDLTFDLGLRLDTQIGVFRFGFAKLLWLPVR